jgi:hypothetical protein
MVAKMWLRNMTGSQVKMAKRLKLKYLSPSDLQVSNSFQQANKMQAFEIDDCTFQAMDEDGKLIEMDERDLETDQSKMLVFNKELFDDVHIPTSSSDEDEEEDEDREHIEGTSGANNDEASLCDKLNKI